MNAMSKSMNQISIILQQCTASSIIDLHNAAQKINNCFNEEGKKIMLRICEHYYNRCSDITSKTGQRLDFLFL